MKIEKPLNQVAHELAQSEGDSDDLGFIVIKVSRSGVTAGYSSRVSCKGEVDAVYTAACGGVTALLGQTPINPQRADGGMTS